MNILIQELKMSFKSLAVWTVSIVAVTFVFMEMFPTISSHAVLMNEFIRNFPPEMVKALGLDAIDFSSVMGFYGFLSVYMTLVSTIFAMKLGVSVLSEEIRIKASDFLVAKPVTRNTIITFKILSVLVQVVILNIIYTIFTLIILKTFSSNADVGILMYMNMGVFLVDLFFVGLGLMISVLVKKIKTVMPIVLGTVFGFFIIQLLNQTLNDEKLSYISPFSYFDGIKIVANSGLDMKYVFIDLVLIIIFVAISYLVFNKRDMPSA